MVELIDLDLWQWRRVATVVWTRDQRDVMRSHRLPQIWLHKLQISLFPSPAPFKNRSLNFIYSLPLPVWSVWTNYYYNKLTVIRALCKMEICRIRKDFKCLRIHRHIIKLVGILSTMKNYLSADNFRLR